MVLACFLCSSFSPFDACWVDLLPDQACLKASHRNVWKLLLFRVTVWLFRSLYFQCWDFQSLESWESIEKLANCAIICSWSFLSLLMCLFYSRIADVASARLMVYFILLCDFGVLPIVAAFVDPVDLSSVLAFAVRRLLYGCAFALTQIVLWGHVVFRLLLWPLPGLLVYLVRLCFHMSVRVDALGSGFHYGFYANLINVLILIILGFLAFVRPRGKQVHALASISPANHSTNSGNPLHTSTSVFPEITEAIGNEGHGADSNMIIDNEVKSLNRTIGNVLHVRSFAVVPNDVCHGATSSIYGGLQAGGYQNDYEEARISEHPSGMMEVISVHGHGAFDGLLTENTQANDDEDGYESEDEHYCTHETLSHVAKVTQAHDDEQLQRVEALIPVTGEAQSLSPETRTESSALCQEDSSLGMIGIRIHMVSGELVCEHWVYDWEPFTIKDLKCIVGEKVGIDPLMVVLVQQQIEEPLDDGVIVVRLPTASLTRELHFTAVFCKTKAYVRDQLLLQADCVSDDATWPSVDLPSACDNDHSIKFREEDQS